jgi:hypothetical protein
MQNVKGKKKFANTFNPKVKTLEELQGRMQEIASLPFLGKSKVSNDISRTSNYVAAAIEVHRMVEIDNLPICQMLVEHGTKFNTLMLVQAD